MSSNLRINRWSSTEEVVDVVRGFKDILHDPHASDEAKQEAKRTLDRLDLGAQPGPGDSGKVTNRATASPKSANESPDAKDEDEINPGDLDH